MIELLFESVGRVAVILMLALTAVGFGLRWPAAGRHRMLAAAVVCSLVMPALIVVAPAWTWLDPIGQDAPAAAMTVGAAQAATNDPAAPVRPAIDGWTLGFLVWSLGFLMSLVVLATGFVRLGRLTRRARLMDHGPWAASADRIAREYGLHHPPRLLESPGGPHLMTWGLLRPKVMLPQDARNWPEDRIHAVLRHELAHIRRRDWPHQLLAEFLRAVYWFNPLAWAVCRRLREESEKASDDMVIGSGVAPETYAQHLLDLARALRAPQRLPSLSFAAARPSAFERRIGAVLDSGVDRRPVPPFVRMGIAVAFLAAALAAAGCGAAVRTAAVQAPAGTAAVTGFVHDSTGARIPGVELRLFYVNDALARGPMTRVSNQVGAFRLAGLEPGYYRLRATLPGFISEERLVNLIAEQEVETNFTLQVAAANTALQVVAPRPVTARGVVEDRPPLTEPVRIGGNVAGGLPLSQPRPVYSPDLREAGIEGAVTLEATIGTDGAMKDVLVVTGLFRLRQAAVEAVRQWRYEPFLLNNQPVEVRTTVTMEFTLRDPD